MMALRAVGYWIDPEVREYDEEVQKLYARDLELPDPRVLRDALGAAPFDGRVADYLRGGHELAAWLGCSYCRFRCGAPEEQLGSRDLTDGVWVWPQGLAHYVEVHQVPLPQEFVGTMGQNGWRVPEVARLDELRDAEWDRAYWKSWYEEQLGDAVGS
jgi:hypothetical protein